MLDNQVEDTIHLFSFPSIDALAAAKVEDLRGLGMGYRAEYLVKSAKLVQERGGAEWLFHLKCGSSNSSSSSSLSRRQYVQDSLMELHGVGRKVRKL